MGGKLSKKGLKVAYEKPIAHVVEATEKPEEREEACPAAESMAPTTGKRDKDSQIPDETEDKEGGGVPAVGVEETCKPEQLDLVPNEEQLVAAISEETTKSPEADPSQLLEVTATTGVESRQEGDGE